MRKRGKRKNVVEEQREYTRGNTPIKSQWKKGIKYQCHSQNQYTYTTHNNNDWV